MSKMSDIIELFIKELLEDTGDVVEIQRNELANYFRCAPSQINYVLSTRFSMDKGYIIESQRGGGGCIKIVQLNIDKEMYISELIAEIGESITHMKAEQIIDILKTRELINEREGKIMGAAISERCMQSPLNIKNEMRAKILKGMILAIDDGKREE